MSSSSSSDDEFEAERKRRLQEAVCGVRLSSSSSIPPPKKTKISKRSTAQQEEDASGQLVTKEMQGFLARKLSEFLDSHYETTTCTATSTKSTPIHNDRPQDVSCVKLLSDSRQPVSIERKPSTITKVTPRCTKNTISSDSDSSDSEAENCRLREAAVDTETILSKR